MRHWPSCVDHQTSKGLADAGPSLCPAGMKEGAREEHEVAAL